MNKKEKIYLSKQSVFSIDELAQIFNEKNRQSLKSRLAYYVDTGFLVRVRRGIYAKPGNVNMQAVAVRIDNPSYISFETILRDVGAIFQYDDAITIASSQSREVDVNSQKIIFRKIKDIVLYNPKGLKYKDYTTIASPERAFLDMLYLFSGYGIDNNRVINWKKCRELVNIYNNKRMKNELFDYCKNI